jgi:hypothetical protein
MDYIKVFLFLLECLNLNSKASNEKGEAPESELHFEFPLNMHLLSF